MSVELFPRMRPRKVAEYYGFPLAWTGAGQSVGIVSLGGAMDVSELESDFDRLGCPMPSVREVVVTPPTISQQQDRSGSLEAHLDIEVIGSICPRAAITSYRAAASVEGLAAAIDRAVEDGNSVLSISWSFTERPGVESSPVERALERAASRGVTVCVASGDLGSTNCRVGRSRTPGPSPDGRAHVGYPGSSPWVLCCGGTELVRGSDVGDADDEEVVWNNTPHHGATGGGVSDVFELPGWQGEAAAGITSTNERRIGRVVPDVSGLAAVGDWEGALGGEEHPTGGTSAVAPLWAALIVLCNAERAALGKGTLGYVNPRLYEIAADGGVFRDIRTGDNRSTEDGPGYFAREGFDACTGWGVPIGGPLAEALLALDEPGSVGGRSR